MASTATSVRPSWKAIGERRHQTTLQRSTTTIDLLGGKAVTTWTSYDTEYWVAETQVPVVLGEEDATVLFVEEGPYRGDVQIQDRILVNGQTLKVIEMVNPGGFNRSLQLHCVRAT